MVKRYTGLRKQVYELARKTGVDTKTMGSGRIGRGIDNIQGDYLPLVLSDLKYLRKSLGIKNKLKKQNDTKIN